MAAERQKSGEAVDDFTYSLVDLHNKGVLCFPYTHTTATALSKGLISTRIIKLRTQVPWLADKWKELDKDKGLYQFVDESSALIELPAHLQTSEFVERRRLARLRHDFMYGLEVNYLRQVSHVQDYFLPQLEAALVYQLLKCAPEKGEFTREVHAYAEVQKISVETAYDELRIKVDHMSSTLVRNYALYQKYVTETNDASNLQQLEAVVARSWFELLGRSWL